MEVTLTLATPEQNIGENAKICYSTKSMSEGGKDITHSLIHSRGHLSALRFAYASFSISGISRSCANQLVRSKHLDFMQQSMRFVDADKGNFEFIMPKGLSEADERLMNLLFSTSLKTYNMLLNTNRIKKEDARAVLPLNTSTAINVTGSLQGWWDFFKLRLTHHAQDEIRELTEEIYKHLAKSYPQVFTETLLAQFRKGA